MNFYLVIMTVLLFRFGYRYANCISDKHLRAHNTRDLIWSHVNWRTNACHNFGGFSCADYSMNLTKVECKNNTDYNINETGSNQQNYTFVKQRRVKRQWMQTSREMVENRLKEKLREINRNKNLEVEEGVRFMAKLFVKLENENTVDAEELKRFTRLAMLSVCDLMNEFETNKKFFEFHLPTVLDSAKAIGKNIFENSLVVDNVVNRLKINIGYDSEYPLPALLTKATSGIELGCTNFSVTYVDSKLRANLNGEEYGKLFYQSDNLFWNAGYYNLYHTVELGPLYFVSPVFSDRYMYAHFVGGVLNTFWHELGHGLTDQLLFGNDKTSQLRTNAYFLDCVKNEVNSASMTIECPHELLNASDGILAEVIADKVGLAMAWDMYKNNFIHLDIPLIHHKNQVLTREQIFFIAFGLDHCAKSEHNLGSRLAVNANQSHPNGRNRASLAVKSIPAYFEAFDCDTMEKVYTNCPVLPDQILNQYHN